MKLSVVIPAHNEEGSIHETVTTLYEVLLRESVSHEIIVVNDNSVDQTVAILSVLCRKIPTLIVMHNNTGRNGFGYTVRFGLDHFNGDCVAIMMADLSDDPMDLVKFYRFMVEKDVDCVFGSRFIRGGITIDYPVLKKVINRMANFLVSVSLGIRYNDSTNAFKLYKKETIKGIAPLIAPHFNLTLELPLKAIVRGYSYAVLPNSWRNRKTGISKLKIREMGSRYFFILLYCLIEKYFSKGDFTKKSR